jgi:hypothetical protein
MGSKNSHDNKMLNHTYNDTFAEYLIDIISLKDFTFDKISMEMVKLRRGYFKTVSEYKENYVKIFDVRKDLRLNHYNLRMRFIWQINDSINFVEDNNEALFFIYPLISKRKDKEIREQENILKKIFNNKNYNYNKLYNLYRKLFEFYTYMLNKFICFEFDEKWDVEIRENMEFFCRNIFTYKKLNERTKELLEDLESGEIDQNKISIFLKRHNLSSPKIIRDYILYGKKVFLTEMKIFSF